MDASTYFSLEVALFCGGRVTFSGCCCRCRGRFEIGGLIDEWPIGLCSSGHVVVLHSSYSDRRDVVTAWQLGVELEVTAIELIEVGMKEYKSRSQIIPLFDPSFSLYVKWA